MFKKIWNKTYIVYNRIVHGLYAAMKVLMHWRTPITITGEGCISRLPEILSAVKSKHPMLVTDPFLAEHLAPQIEAILRDAGVEYTVFSDVAPNPPTASMPARCTGKTSATASLPWAAAPRWTRPRCAAP